MRARIQMTTLLTAIVLGIFGTVSLAACCTVQRTVGGVTEPTPPPEPFPASPALEQPDVQSEVVNCDEFRARACCDADTEQCSSCLGAAWAEKKQWDFQCRKLEPQPDRVFDCSAPAPLKPCCRALLPKCTECAAQNRAIDAAYTAACGDRAVAP